MKPKNNKPPLASPHAEQAVIAGLFRSKDPTSAILSLELNADLFTVLPYRYAFLALAELLHEGLPLDYATFEQRLEPADLRMLQDAVEAVVSDANLAVHARLLHESHTRRWEERTRQQAIRALQDDGDLGEVRELLEALQDPSRALAYARPREAVRVALIPGGEIQPVAVRWLWDGWLAEGKIHLVAGPPGTGKTTMCLAFAATVSCGGRWPSGEPAQPRNVVIWSAEDDIADTLRGRLEACGADIRRIHFVGSTTTKDGERSFDPATDCAALCVALREVGDVGLLLVDPISSAVGGDSHKNGEVRRALQPLVDLARETRCAVVGISHHTKPIAGRDLLDRIIGSIAFGALARVAMTVVKASEAQGGGQVLVRAKSNLGPDNDGWRFDLRQAELAAFPGVEASYVAWGDVIHGSAREIVAQAEALPNTEERPELDASKAFLLELLDAGPMYVTKVREEVDAAGYAWRTVERAKKELGVVAAKSGVRDGWRWQLPAQE